MTSNSKLFPRRSVVVPVSRCVYWSLVSRYWYLDSVTPVDSVRVKSTVDSFLDSPGVPVWVSINKLYFVLKRVVICLASMFQKFPRFFFTPIPVLRPSRLHTTISTVVNAEAVCASKILPIGIFITLSLRSKILLYVSIPTLPAHYAENERFLSFPSSPLSGYSLDDQKGHGCGRDLRTRSIFSLPRLVRWINV